MRKISLILAYQAVGYGLSQIKLHRMRTPIYLPLTRPLLC